MTKLLKSTFVDSLYRVVDSLGERHMHPAFAAIYLASGGLEHWNPLVAPLACASLQHP
jgi:hypothetical protein